MKTRNLLLALGCAAALTACTTNDEPNVAPAPAKKVVTLSVDVNEPADTRVEYEKEGTVYKFAWSIGDQLYVYYKEGETEKVTTFTIDDSSINGKKASFKGTLPESSDQVTIVYAGVDFRFDESGKKLNLSGLFGQVENNVAADLARRTLLVATTGVIEPGVLPDVTLNHALSYLLLKQGLQVTQKGLTLDDGDPELVLDFGVTGGLNFSSLGFDLDDSVTTLGSVYVKDGELVKDCLVPLFVTSEGATAGYTVTGRINEFTETSETVYQPTFTYEAGKIYVVEAGNEKWLPVTVAVPEVIVDLSELTEDFVAQDGDILTGKATDKYMISIAAGATVTLRDVDITSFDSEGPKYAGINCLGDATLVIEGTNHVKGAYHECSGIHIPEGYTLTIEGTGKLTAESNGYGAGIGAGYYWGTAGNIIINSGEIVAIGGGRCAGIGGGCERKCGDITINGGTITATGNGGAGIGSGESSACGNITINGGTITATTTSGNDAAAGIGAGYDRASCGNITITGGTITAKGCGGDKIWAGGSKYTAAGIGGGCKGTSCGNITITEGVTKVVATKGGVNDYDIGPGSDGYNAPSTCGTVTIGSGVVIKDENDNDAVIYGVS